MGGARDRTSQERGSQISEDEVFVLEVGEEFDYVHVPAIRKALSDALEAGARAVVFDLSECTFMDSAGLRAVLDAIRALGPRCVALAEPDDNLRRVFVTTGLEERLQMCLTLGNAVAAARSAAAT